MRLKATLLVLLLAVLCVLTAVIAQQYRGLQRESGLRGWCLPGTGTAEGVREELDTDLFTAALRRRAATREGPVSCEWRGFLVPPKSARYRLVVFTNGRVSVDIDDRTAIPEGWPRPETQLELDRRLHAITVRFHAGWDPPALDLRWSSDGGVPVQIDRVLLAGHRVSSEEARRRRRLAAAAAMIPRVWLALAAAGAVLATAQWMRRRSDPILLTILAIDAVLFFTASWWGLPDYQAWAPDEIGPWDTRVFLEGVASGYWATLYPPLHYAALALVQAPYLAAGWLQLVEFQHLRTYSEMFFAGRMLSVLMALGIVALTFGITRELFGRRAAIIAAAIVSVSLPLTYYAKTSNADVPYVFWLALSLRFYARAYATGEPRSFYLFALTGAAAICTKDQAYGFYVLPALYMCGGAVVAHVRRRALPGVPTLRVLAATAGIGIAAFLVFGNVLFNPEGFREHLRIIRGPASQGFRMYPPTAAGHLELFAASSAQLASAMSWPLFVASLAALAAAVRARLAAAAWLMLPAVSYYVTFIAVIGYVYDRFFLGVVLLLAIVSGWMLDRWTGGVVAVRRVRLAALAGAIAYALARVVSLDLAMLRDSRYVAEQWVLQHAQSSTRVATAGPATYLPREAVTLARRMQSDLASLERDEPDLIIVNVATAHRGGPESGERQLYDALSSGRAGYDRVLQHRSHVPLGVLNWERAFRRLREVPTSNLPKVNPLLEVYARRASALRQPQPDTRP